MTEYKHTPGPWRIVRPHDGSGFTKIIGPNGEVIDIFGSGYFNNKNIDLIADAWQLPDLRRENAELKEINKELIEALEEIETFINNSVGIIGYHLNGSIAEWDDLDATRVINKALRKARGEKNDRA